MRTHRWIALATLVITIAGSDLSRADGDEKVKFAELPKVVQKTIKDKYPEATIRGASKGKEDGETLYEVELTIEGKAVDVVLDDDGEVEAIEREIPAEDLPRAVLNAARAKFPATKIDKVEEITADDDVVVYELTVTVGGKATEVVMSPNGKILEDDDDDKDQPKATGKDDDKAKKSKDGDGGAKPKG